MPTAAAAEQDMLLAERGLMAPPGHIATRERGSLISAKDVAFWHENGYLRIPGVFTSDELAALEEDFEWLVQEWATAAAGWQGPWCAGPTQLLCISRRVLMR
eukprot:SAG31_NODE_1134_length_9737_cov_13.245798_6_plen_102_part_00